MTGNRTTFGTRKTLLARKAVALRVSLPERLPAWILALALALAVLISGAVRAETIAVGDQVSVEGSLAKDGSKSANARSVMLPDGRRVFAGSSGGNIAPNQ